MFELCVFSPELPIDDYGRGVASHGNATSLDFATSHMPIVNSILKIIGCIDAGQYRPMTKRLFSNGLSLILK